MSELLNISDQLEGYLGENMGIINKMQKAYGFTLEQTIKCAEIAAQEMIADCLFHIDEKLEFLEEISSSICCSSTRSEIEDVSESISEIKDAINNFAELYENKEEQP